jgi:hypothetical protein
LVNITSILEHGFEQVNATVAGSPTGSAGLDVFSEFWSCITTSRCEPLFPIGFNLAILSVLVTTEILDDALRFLQFSLQVLDVLY